MLLLPRDKYGQFSGAMALIRAVGLICCGVLAGLFMDFWKHLFPEGLYYYRFSFIWYVVFNGISFYFFYRVYRTWKRLGGATGFVPPETPVHMAELRPRPDETCGLHPRMVLLTSIAFAGALLGELAFIVYWIVFEPRPEYVRAHLISFSINLLVYWAFIKFMKFMERP